MPLSDSDLVGVHAVVGPLDEIIERRRATYDAAIELARGDGAAPRPNPAVLDHPIVRGHLADVLSGVAELDAQSLVSIDAVVAASGRWSVAGREIRVASTGAAPSVLTGAMRRIGAELDRNGASGLADVVLHEGGPTFGPALQTLQQGIELAIGTAPALVLDLLPHVGLIALLDRARAGRLGSASAREFPGLVVLPAPLTPLEAAEGLVHEGAHQKFFDLAIVGSVFAEGHHSAPSFSPPWAKDGAAAWPLEQTVAAYHAYCCLDAFFRALGRSEVHKYSLLPLAAERARVLGEWIARHTMFLGDEGRAFFGGLAGRGLQSDVSDARNGARRPMMGDGRRAVRRCGPWELTMRWTQPVEILWNRTTT